MLRIVTDGAADMPAEWEREYDVKIIPVNIQFGDRTYLQYAELDNLGFYKMVEQTRTVPKTAQPTPHQFIQFYKKVAQPGDTIISIHVTSKLSGTYASAVQAAEEVKDVFHVLPVDSMVGSVAIGIMCREARKMDRSGKTPEEIVRSLEDIKPRVRAIFTLDTLEYARMSGRVGTMQAAMASLMSVKPIAILKDGVLNIAERVRTRKASIRRVIELGQEEFGQTPIYLGVLHANDIESGRMLMEEACKHFNLVGEPTLSDLSISVAANLGPGTVGLVFYPAE